MDNKTYEQKQSFFSQVIPLRIDKDNPPKKEILEKVNTLYLEKLKAGGVDKNRELRDIFWYVRNELSILLSYTKKKGKDKVISTMYDMEKILMVKSNAVEGKELTISISRFMGKLNPGSSIYGGGIVAPATMFELDLIMLEDIFKNDEVSMLLTGYDFLGLQNLFSFH